MEYVETKVTYKYPLDTPTQENPICVYIEIYRRGEKLYSGGISLCKGVHRLYWTLTGEPFEVCDFEFSDMPDKVVRCEEVHWDQEEGKWTALFENNRGKDDDKVAAFTYQYNCDPRELRFLHDPTIAVTNDPPPDHRPPYQP